MMKHIVSDFIIVLVIQLSPGPKSKGENVDIKFYAAVATGKKILYLSRNVAN